MDYILPTEEELRQFKGLLDYLRILANDGINSNIETQVLFLLKQTVPFYSHLVMEDRFPEIQRLTVNKRVLNENRRIWNIDHLKYPPKKCVKSYGRCNMPGQSVLYATFNSLTALSEIRPEIGDIITTSKWRMKPDVTLRHCPIFLNQPETTFNPRLFEIEQLYRKSIREYPNEIQEHINLLSQFVADVFTKRINSVSNLDYIFSAYFSDKIFNEYENRTIEAIYYPSVKQSLVFENIAIKPESFDTKYELIDVSDSIVETTPSINSFGYMMLGLGDCKNFDYSNNRICWTDKYKLPDNMIEDVKNKYGVLLTEAVQTN